MAEITITTTVTDDNSPFKITLTPRQGFNDLFQINAGPQFDIAWVPELIALLMEARRIAEPDDYIKPEKLPVGLKKKKHAPKM
jgi:hypothetical protein